MIDGQARSLVEALGNKTHILTVTEIDASTGESTPPMKAIESRERRSEIDSTNGATTSRGPSLRRRAASGAINKSLKDLEPPRAAPSTSRVRFRSRR